mgnify:FL=1
MLVITALTATIGSTIYYKNVYETALSDLADIKVDLASLKKIRDVEASVCSNVATGTAKVTTVYNDAREQIAIAKAVKVACGNVKLATRKTITVINEGSIKDDVVATEDDTTADMQLVNKLMCDLNLMVMSACGEHNDIQNTRVPADTDPDT